jgi:Sigma-70 region 2
MVWGVCRRVLRDHHDAEDAFRATFLVLARKAASVVPREKVGKWLHGVAYQTAMKARATRAKRRVRETNMPSVPAPEFGRHEHLDGLVAESDHKLRRLPEQYRVPIVLCELEGKTHREAAGLAFRSQAAQGSSQEGADDDSRLRKLDSEVRQTGPRRLNREQRTGWQMSLAIWSATMIRLLDSLNWRTG